ncbi:MAG: UvrD-helicase domain-containing protein [Paludibacter sp.]|nr:UvrD-helicase domain-containing protein [Bacteroidales bacterium]MCM1068998.1 UvrD-helicase domain-containing protein [Prevotella sp.]MCM1353661.1 UvrD-helicase domain-containing protein [Bacteroides sp.]MCM1441990.1 UvrD-helicase domain-containing protein [Muribaculum sp.]MCM1481554.1 UvrD-helicase domain-containing protein [Paludibacter sp.]
MSWFNKLFNLRHTTSSNSYIPEEYQVVIDFENQLNSLLQTDKYISRKEYTTLYNNAKNTAAIFHNLANTQTLSFYCDTHHIDILTIHSFLNHISDLAKLDKNQLIYTHNASFIRRHMLSDKIYLDTILNAIDPNILLDAEQRHVVLSDEDYTLVVAGAGTGKTTTIAAKVKYLIEKQGILPEQILVISFTNKAVGELQQRINKTLKIPCPITTFHKTGYTILHKQDNTKKNIVDNGFLFHVVNNYLKGNILQQPELVNKLILFFGSYFDAPFEGDNLNDFFNYLSKADFSTLRGNIKEYTQNIIDKRTGKHITITHETLRSGQEVQLANFLYLNQIDYEYEAPYPYHIPNSHKQYTPDFTIKQGNKIAYIEHFGISEDGKNARYTQDELNKYKKAINNKICLHRQHKTDLIYTFSCYKDGNNFLSHLRQQLIEHGFVLNQRSSEEVFTKIVQTEENKYILRLVSLVCTFIQNFKVNNYTIDDFHRFEAQTSNERSKLFLALCEQCYYEYSKRLKERHAIDFEDMLNDSVRILKEQEKEKLNLQFKYIIIDEYQDISRQRFDLSKELSKICDAKIIAVGDDWQSIYAYAGSDITLFTQFKKTMGYGLELKITKTYRNAQEVIDIAGQFIQKNTTQLHKALISTKHINNPIIIETYPEEFDRKKYQGKGGKYYLIGKTVENILDNIFAENPKASILLLGRFGFDAYNLCKSNDFLYDEKSGNVRSQKHPHAVLEFLTIHRAKGLGYDNVIIINARNESYGFPAKIQDDPVLKYVVKDDHSIEYAEERRLFYVALTRTKNRVYLVVPEEHPSEFITELIHDNPNIIVHGQLHHSHIKVATNIKRCPICGYPMQLRYKSSYGLHLWLCANEPEICDFMTNDLSGGNLPILKCDKCKDGYLIVKLGKTGYFLGCTNYKHDKSGCNNMLSPIQCQQIINHQL